MNNRFCVEHQEHRKENGFQFSAFFMFFVPLNQENSGIFQLRVREFIKHCKSGLYEFEKLEVLFEFTRARVYLYK